MSDRHLREEKTGGIVRRGVLCAILAGEKDTIGEKEQNGHVAGVPGCEERRLLGETPERWILFVWPGKIS